MRSAAWIAALAAAALLWGTAVTVLTDDAGWPWFAAPASIAVLAGAFGWLRRGRDIAPVFGLAFVLSYAAIAGLALVRFGELDPWEATALVYPYTARWPAIAIGGIPFALMCAIFVAMPASLLPHRRRASAAGERFWAFIHERNAALAAANAPPSERGCRLG
jgi:hypothetical protein